MSIKATYLELSTQLYEISKPTATEYALTFYKSYAGEASGMILEPMCGAGRFLMPLAKDGYKIEESDTNEHMLDLIKHQERRFRLLIARRGRAQDLKHFIKTPIY